MKLFSVAVLCLTFASMALADFCGLKHNGEWKICSGDCTIDFIGYSECLGPRGDIGDIGTGCAVFKSRDSDQPLKQCGKGKGCGYLGNTKDKGCY